MENMESSCVPPGFRFHPTDEELVGYYLRKKVASQRIDLDVIRDIDLYQIEPWDLQDTCKIGYEKQNEWYFFSHKDKKYPTGSRTNRATMAGFWKATGRDKAVYDKSKLIGMRKTLVFYKGRAPNGQKTDWIMHEYRLESDENGPIQEEGWVVCRAFKKRTSSQTSKRIEGWDSSCFLHEPSSLNSLLNPSDYITRQQPNSFLLSQNVLCKQELQKENMHGIMHADQFVQLPQLESPSVPLPKRACSTSLLSENLEEDLSINSASFSNNGKKITTDWRALDKFVASQLSQEDNRHEADGVSCGFLGDNRDDLDSALMSLQSGMDEVNKLDVFLSSTSDCDIGLCVFEK